MDEVEDTKSLVAKWVENIRLYETEYSPWEKKGQDVVKRYTDARNTRTESRRRYNILWSNVQTLQPALYFSPPKPNIERRFKDKDPVGLEASEILERAATYYVNETSFHDCAKQAVLDRLLPGRGVLWVRYVPHFKDVEIPSNDGPEVTDDAPEPEQELEYEEVLADYVHWRDFGHVISRTWEEVPAIWRKVYLDYDELVARFGKKKADTIPLDYSPWEKDAKTREMAGKKATIYEIWDRTKKQVVWLHKEVLDALDVKEDFLKLKGFFPCAKPLYATLCTDSLVPAPDYLQYRDQAAELDEITARIASITKSLKVAGIYDSTAEGVQNLLGEGLENKLIPVKSWALYAEKGGISKAVEFLPIDMIITVLTGLHELRDKVKADLNEITGIADIIRGNSDPSETAEAQHIKGQFATLRLSDMQNGVSQFLKETVQIMAEVIAGHFSVNTLKMVSGAQLSTQDEKQQIQQQQQIAQQHYQQAMQIQQAHQQAPQPGIPAPQAPKPPDLPPQMQEKLKAPSWEDVMSLLKNKAALCFKIDIETDSTIKQDQEADKASRMEFVKTAGDMITQAAQVQQPALAPLVGEMLMFAVRGFKNARQLEQAFEDTIEHIQNNPPPKPQDPAVVKAQTDLQIAQMRMQQEKEEGQAKMQADALWAKQEADNDARNAANQAAMDQRKFQADMALEEKKHQDQMELERMKIATSERVEMAKHEMTMKNNIEVAKHRPKPSKE